MLYSFKLSKYKNLRLVLTTNYLILITLNGVLKFKTNFNNLFFKQQNLYIYTKQLNKPFFINQKYYNYTFNYLTILYNSVFSLSNLCKKSLIIKGVGYKFLLENRFLKLRVGYSHYIKIKIPGDIMVIINNLTTITIYSNNLLRVSQFSAILKLQKPINKYKGTGIFYLDEKLYLKNKNINKNKNVK